MDTLKFLVAILAASVAVVLLLPGSADAKTARPCWKDVVSDWVPDGRVDGTYKVRCYQAALKHLPPDLREYSSAEADFKRALLSVAAKGKGGGPPNPDAVIVGAKHDKRESQASRNAHQPPLFRRVLDWLGPSNAETIPTPLLVLAGIALLLLLAAAGSYIARWIQARKLRPATAPHHPRKGP